MSNEKVFVIPRNDGEAVEIGKVLEQVPEAEVLNAYYAYVADTREKNNIGRPTETINVTQQIQDYEKAIEKIADEKNPEHDAMINRGIEWERNTTKAVEDRLVAENENVRVFSTSQPPRPFTSVNGRGLRGPESPRKPG